MNFNIYSIKINYNNVFCCPQCLLKVAGKYTIKIIFMVSIPVYLNISNKINNKIAVRTIPKYNHKIMEAKSISLQHT